MAFLGSVAKAATGPFASRMPVGSNRYNAGNFGSLTNTTALSALNAYKGVGTLYGTVNRIAEAVSLTQWTLYRQSADKGDREYIDDATAPANHPATALWTHPNPDMTRKTFLHRTVQSAILSGEAYWMMNKAEHQQPEQSGVTSGLELWPLRPDRVAPQTDKDGYLVGYLYSNGSERIPLPKSAIVPVGFVPDPTDLYHGFGPVQSMMTDLDTERYAAQMQRNAMINGAEPGGIIQFDTPLSQTQWDEFVNRWREMHQGVANTNRVAILERGTWVANAHTNRDMQFEQLRKQGRDLIFMPFGMHSAIMGVSEHVNKANAEAAEVMFSRWIVRPKLEEIKEALNERVLPYIEPMLTMEYVDPTPNDVATNTNVGVALFLGQLATRGEARTTAGLELLGDERDDEFVQPAPLPTAAPPHVQDPAGRGIEDAVAKTWPAVMNGHEMRMAHDWTQRLSTVGAEAMDYLNGRR